MQLLSFFAQRLLVGCLALWGRDREPIGPWRNLPGSRRTLDLQRRPRLDGPLQLARLRGRIGTLLGLPETRATKLRSKHDTKDVGPKQRRGEAFHPNRSLLFRLLMPMPPLAPSRLAGWPPARQITYSDLTFFF